MPKLRQHCANCHEEIERADRAACGWQHIKKPSGMLRAA